MSAAGDAPLDPRETFPRVPFTRLLGVRREFSQAGRARLVLEARPELENMVGSVHGGVIATLLDVAMASAAVSKVDFTLTVVTLGMHNSFLHPARGRLTADGEVLAVDAGMATCRARILDEAGRLVAQAQGSFRYLPHR
jgi:uncharacterized protein (TIGR00369 family)